MQQCVVMDKLTKIKYSNLIKKIIIFRKINQELQAARKIELNANFYARFQIRLFVPLPNGGTTVNLNMYMFKFSNLEHIFS